VTTRAGLTLGALPVAQTERSGCRPDGLDIPSAIRTAGQGRLPSRRPPGPLARACGGLSEGAELGRLWSAVNRDLPMATVGKITDFGWVRSLRSHTVVQSQAFGISTASRLWDLRDRMPWRPPLRRRADGVADRLSTRPADRSDT
jgi:hypothetical protein